MNRSLTLCLATLSLAACGQHPSSASITASTADKPVPVLSCESTTKALDFGTTVKITSGGLEGGTTATVRESTIEGVRVVVRTAVQEESQRWIKTFTGDGFTLTVNLESLASTTSHPAAVSFVKNGRTSSVRLTCHAGA